MSVSKVENPEQAAALVRWYAAMPQKQVNENIDTLECVEPDLVPIMAGCFKGAPQGFDVEQNTFDTFCMKLAASGAFDVPGCDDTQQELLRDSPMPDCLGPDHQEVLDYCDARPHAEPDFDKEGICWVMRLAPELGQQIRQTPPCWGGGAGPGSGGDGGRGSGSGSGGNGGEDEVEDPDEDESQRMLWIIGGVAALAVVGGGAYYLSRRR